MLGPIYLNNNGSSDFGKYFYCYSTLFEFTCKFKLRAQSASTLAYIINTTSSYNYPYAYKIGIDANKHPYFTSWWHNSTFTLTFDSPVIWAGTEYTLTMKQNNASGSYSITCTVSGSSQTLTSSTFSQFIYGDFSDSSATFGDSNVDLLSVTLKGKQYNVSTQAVFTFTESNCTGLTFSKAISGPATTSYTWKIDNYATVKYYNGSSWVRCQVQYYNGSAWKICVPMYYDGSSWKYLVNI